MNNLDQEILNLIDEYFGQSEVYMWSTYILPNGNFLSPYNILEEYPDLEYEFTYEHSDFTDLLTYYTKDGEEVRWRDIFKALNKHTIKMNVTYPYLYLPEERITSEQLRAIKNILTNYSKGFTTHKDIWDYEGLLIVAPKGEKLYTTEELLFVEDVIKDIQMFYRTGFLESQGGTVDQKILNHLKDLFGQSEVYMWSTYILPNGYFLNPENHPRYERGEWVPDYEHYDFEVKMQGISIFDYTKTLEDKCVKMNVTYPYITLPKERITPQQLKAIKDILTNYIYELTYHQDMVDGLLVVAPKGEKIYTEEDLLFVEDIIQDIQDYYRTGFLESQSNTQIVDTVSDTQTLKTVEYKGFKINVPDNLTLYHGTASENEESIKLHGLDPIYSDYVDDYIWLETDYYTAVNWGKRHSNQGASVYAIDVKNLDINLLDIDYYNYEYFDDIIDEYGYLEITDITFIYKGKIPPEVLYLIE